MVRVLYVPTLTTVELRCLPYLFTPPILGAQVWSCMHDATRRAFAHDVVANPCLVLELTLEYFCTHNGYSHFDVVGCFGPPNYLNFIFMCSLPLAINRCLIHMLSIVASVLVH